MAGFRLGLVMVGRPASVEGWPPAGKAIEDGECSQCQMGQDARFLVRLRATFTC